MARPCNPAPNPQPDGLSGSTSRFRLLGSPDLHHFLPYGGQDLHIPTCWSLWCWCLSAAADRVAYAARAASVWIPSFSTIGCQWASSLVTCAPSPVASNATRTTFPAIASQVGAGRDAFAFRVHFASDQDCSAGQVQPQQQCDRRAQRSIDLAVRRNQKEVQAQPERLFRGHRVARHASTPWQPDPATAQHVSRFAVPPAASPS